MSANYQAKLQPKAAAFINELHDNTGATKSAIMAALIDFIMFEHHDEAVEFILRRVEFYSKGYQVKRKSPSKNE